MTDEAVKVGRVVNPFTVGLVVVAGVALLGAVVLGGAAAGEAASWRGGDAVLVASLGVWSDFALLVGVVAGVGAAVTAGVRWTLRQAGLDV